MVNLSTKSNGIGAAGLGFAPVSNMVKNQAGTDFQAIWDKQNTSNQTYTDTNQNKPSNLQSTDTSMHEKAALSNRHKEVTEDVEVEQSARPLTKEELEEALEAIGTVLADFMKQVAQELDISEEELTSLLNDLDLEPIDLLQNENLLAIVLEVSGEEDMMSLITNEDVFQKYQNLTSQLEGVMKELEMELDVEADEVPQLLSQFAEGLKSDNEVGKDLGAIEIVQTNVVSENEKPQEESKETSNLKEDVNDSINQMNSPNEVEEMKLSNKDSKENSSDKGQDANSFLANLHTELIGDEVIMEEMSAVSDVDTESILRQIMDYMKVQVKPDLSNLEMQLHPESLGTLNIHLASREGVVTAQLIAQNEAVKNALESQIVQLEEQFQEQGIKVEAIEVTVQTHEFERNLDQHKEQAESREGKKNKTRKINLNMSEEGLEEMTQEDQIAVEMMTANGNTIDYTA